MCAAGPGGGVAIGSTGGATGGGIAGMVASSAIPPSLRVGPARPSPAGRGGSGVGARLTVLGKKGSSSAIEERTFGAMPERIRVSSRSTSPRVIDRCSSRSELKMNSWPERVRTSQRSGAAVAAFGRKILNWCPQWVHLTVVPRSETRASSKSYSVWQRSH